MEPYKIELCWCSPGCGDGVLRLWDLMARKVIGSASIAGEKDLYTALSFNEDGKMILAGGIQAIYESYSHLLLNCISMIVLRRCGGHFGRGV